ncbi:MAG: PhzF family phenazine biosynthesis protein [Ruminococcaceae bacterium]|nr:PhzF family phenazine biosynthesis protein [Oscillospiraceae bacterium]
MKINAYALNSFAKTKEGGNPAGVVLNADSLSEEEMRKIAAVLGFSETAFVMQSNTADFKVRFFTPKEEVDLCGHATIAAFYAMSNLNLLKPGEYKQETRAGILGIEIHDDGFVMMDQSIPIFSELLTKEEVADSLNLCASEILPDLPVQVVSTGLRDVMVPVRSMEILDKIRPDMEKIKTVSRKYHTVGYHVFSLESLHGANAYCRNFAPLYGIPKEAATGTSSGALGCYLYHYGKISREQASNIVFEQGYSMKRPSEIRVFLGVKENEIYEVKVGGKAMNLTPMEVEI